MEKLLHTSNITRSFIVGKNKIEVLKNIDITVEKGTLTILRGRSGSGKTTLMNILGLLDNPTSGKVYFNDADVTGYKDEQKDMLRRTKMGFVFQSVALVSTMSAYQNVDFGMRIAGLGTAERKKRCIESLELVGLGKRMKHMPEELSGGEQQRVAIARAIAHKPQIIFADEPTAELDTHMGMLIVKLFKELVAKEGVTILMTSHDPSIAEVADRVYSN